jgi:hypothetical protein
MRRLQYKKRRSVRNQKRRFHKSGRKTIKGGDLSTPTFSVPIDKFYPLNSYQHDPSVPPQLSSERLTVSGGKNSQRRKRRQRRGRTMRGGSANLTSLINMQDPLLAGPNAQSFPNAFANVAGSGSLAYSLLGQSAPVGNTGGMISVTTNASTLA